MKKTAMTTRTTTPRMPPMDTPTMAPVDSELSLDVVEEVVGRLGEDVAPPGPIDVLVGDASGIGG